MALNSIIKGTFRPQIPPIPVYGQNKLKRTTNNSNVTSPFRGPRLSIMKFLELLSVKFAWVSRSETISVPICGGPNKEGWRGCQKEEDEHEEGSKISEPYYPKWTREGLYALEHSCLPTHIVVIIYKASLQKYLGMNE